MFMYNLAEIVGPWLYVAPTKRWRHQRWKFGQKISPAPPRGEKNRPATPRPPRPAPPASKNTLKFSLGAPRRKTFPYLRKSAGGAGQVLKWPPPRPAGAGCLLPPLAAHTHADLHRSLLHLARKLQIEIGAIYALVYPCMV